MARERMVTRTINAQECTCKVASKDFTAINDVVITITGDFPTKDAQETEIKRQVKKGMITVDGTFLAVVSSKTITKIYGMAETEFLKYAKEVTRGAQDK